MKTTILLTLLTLLFCSSVFSQEYEYGKPEELKGLTKLFIDTGVDVKSRVLMLKELKNAKLDMIEVLDSSEKTEIYLLFAGGTKEGPTTVTNVFGSATIQTRTLKSGGGTVFIQGKDKNKLRLLMSGEYVQKGTLLDKPAEKFIKDFIKMYKKVNSIK